jgi:hypothetical protein
VEDEGVDMPKTKSPKWNKDELKEKREEGILKIACLHSWAVKRARKATKFTCDKCKKVKNCWWSFDVSNINGDCLV